MIHILDLKENIPDTKKYGYFCYNYGNEKIEALYSINDPSILYNDITRINKAEDFYKKDDNIRRAYLKSRAKSLEYFINKTVFQNKYGNEPYLRIIFPLQKAYRNYEFNDNSFKNEIELDGCFFIKKKFILENAQFPFELQFFKVAVINIYSHEIIHMNFYQMIYV